MPLHLVSPFDREVETPPGDNPPGRISTRHWRQPLRDICFILIKAGAYLGSIYLAVLGLPLLFFLLLAAFAALQVAFIEREPLLAKVPQAALLVDALCARLPCLERREHGTSVRLLARDVREHPNYRDALLVNATIVNDAKTPSPYPVIDLRLRDAAGNVLSARQFQPGEYLDQSINIAEGMPSGRPVYIVLELAGKASNAVSFEFTFL